MMLRLVVTTSILVGVAASPVAAQFSVFSDEGAFQAALGAFTVHDFEAPHSGPVYNFSYDGGQAFLPVGEIVDTSQPSDKDPIFGERAFGYWPEVHGPMGSIVFSSVMDGFGTFLRDPEIRPLSLSFYLNERFLFSHTLSSYGNGSTYFIGFQAGAGSQFNQVRFGHQTGDWVTYDNMTVSAGTATNVVPEPASMVLLGTGLALLGVAARRRRRHGLLSEA